MVKVAIAGDYLLHSLVDLSNKHSFLVGLIIGQPCCGKDYVIHFAKTPLAHIEDGPKKPSKQTIPDIKENLLAEHANHVTRMLPGGMYVLGIFMITPDDVLSSFHSKLKSVLSLINKQLDSNKYLYGNCSSSKLIFNYATNSKKYSCKSYDTATFNVQPVDFKFMPDPYEWISIKCSFNIDHLKYMRVEEKDWSIQKHVQEILDTLCASLDASVYLFNGDIKESSDTFEIVDKKKLRSLRTMKQDPIIEPNNSKPMQLTIFQSRVDSSECAVLKAACELRMIGQVACKLWLQPKMNVTEVTAAVKQDILRSLAARLEMHWDSLTEEERSDDVNCIHEPPRRVLIKLPNHSVTMSDYLFPGEGPEDAKMSLEELLDIKVEGSLRIQDVEGQADTSQYYCIGALENESVEMLPHLTTDTRKFLYFGIGFAFLVLVLSLWLNGLE